MVAVLLRLKVRLLWAAFKRDSPWQVVAAILGWLCALVLGLAFGLPLIRLQVASAEVREAALVAVSLTLVVGWLMASLILASSDSTLDADVLTLFPLRRRDLAVGLFGAAMLGPGTLFTVLVVAGMVLGVVSSGPGAVLVVLGGLMLVGQCVAWTRLITTWLSRAARSKRGKDVALFVVPLVAIVPGLGVSTLGAAAGETESVPGWLSGAIRVAGYSPPGLPARAMELASRDQLGAAGLALLGSAVVLTLLMWLWISAVDRLSTTSPSSAGGARRVGLDLFGGTLRWLPRSRLGAVAAKELRLQWRDPRQRVAALGLLAGPLALIVSQGLGSSSRGGVGPLFMAALPALLVATTAANMWGFDGPRYWVQVAAPDDPRSDLYGKVLARVVTMTVPTVVFVALAAMVVGRPELFVSGLLFAGAGGGLVLGIAAPFSLLTPVPAPEEAKNIFSSRGGGSVSQVLPTMIMLVLAAVILLPLGLLNARYSTDAGPLMALGLIEIAIAGVSSWFGVRYALRRLTRAEPELLAKLSFGRQP